MTVKEFFKSTAFKCIITLLCVLLISGIFLTVMNGLLEVTEEERFERALAKIYGGNVKTTEISLENQTTSFDTSLVDAAYSVDDGNYLIKSTGKNGYGGDVTCWVVVKLSSDGKAITGVGNVVVDKAPNESYLSKISKSHLEQISEITYTDGKVYDFGWNDNKQPGADFIATGASCTMRAISNAVNGAINFVKSYALGVTVEVKTPYDEFEYTDYINKKDTTVSFTDGMLTFNIITKGNGEADPFTIKVTLNGDKKIESFTVVNNGSTYGYESSMMPVKDFVGKSAAELAPKLDDGTLSTGATKSNTLCLNAALFAASNYDKAIKLAYANTTLINLDATTWSVDGDNVTYTVKTKSNDEADPFTLEITVNAEKKIESFKVTTNGSTYGYDGYMMSVSKLVGKNAEELTAMLDDGTLSTGATKSNTLCLQAALFAVSNYDLATILAGGNE